MIIYKITNKQTGSSYVGQTKFTVAERVKQHIRHGSKIGREMARLGAENFDISVIDNADTADVADSLERFWISFYNCRETGYNTLIGGRVTKSEIQQILKIKKEKPKQRRYKKRRVEKIVNEWLEEIFKTTSIKKRYLNDKYLYFIYQDVCEPKFPYPKDGKFSKNQRLLMINDLIYKKYGVSEYL